MKREQIEEALLADGWTKDRFGHFQRTETRRRPHVDHPEGVVFVTKLRIKMQATSLRVEVQVDHPALSYSPATKEWVRFGGDYYSKIVQLDDGRVRIGSHIIGKKK